MGKRNEEDELMERIAREMMKNGDVKTAFDVEEKLRKSFCKNIDKKQMFAYNILKSREE